MSALRRRATAAPPALEAHVSNPDPSGLTVTIDDFDGDQLARHAWPAVAWPVGSTAVPARGDRCLVVKSEIGDVWVVAAEWTGDALAWEELTPSADWSADSSGAAPGGARTQGGRVTLRGIVTKAAAPQRGEPILAGRLPRGIRPVSERSFVALVGEGVAARVRVLADGRVLVGELPSQPPASATVTLDGISYWVED
jgi:hypothetical protein